MSTLHPQAETRLAVLQTRPHLRALSIFVLLFALGFSAGSLFHVPFAHAFRSLCTLVIAPLTFGQGGHVQFVASRPQAALERAASWDVSMVLSIEGVPREHTIALNPRRLFYLPLLTLCACVLAAPLRMSPRQRQKALLLGIPVLLAVALLSVWLIAVFMFAKVPGLVYSLTGWQTNALRIAYEGWVTPLSNKFAMPLLLAAALLAWQQRAKATTPELERLAPSGSKPLSAGRRAKRTQKRAGATPRKGSRASRRA